MSLKISVRGGEESKKEHSHIYNLKLQNWMNEMANPQQHNDRHVGDPCLLDYPNKTHSLSSILDKVVATLFKDFSFKKIYFLC